MRRAWSPIRSCARWAPSSAACATTIRPATGRPSRSRRAPQVVVRGKSGPRTRRRSTSSSSTASRRRSAKARWRWRCEFPVPDDRTAGSYQKVERKVGDYATAAAAVQISLDADGTIREAGIALSAAGPCAVRVDEAERLLAGQKPSARADSRRGRRRVGTQRAAGRPARQRRVQEASGRRARRARACVRRSARLGVQA